MIHLLDTHVFLWWAAGDARTDALVDVLAVADAVCVSVVSCWELRVKAQLGKIHLPAPPEDEIERIGFQLLPVEGRHTRALSTLPPLHRDPFDRMLAAQALCERAVLVTADHILASYPVPVLRL